MKNFKSILVICILTIISFGCGNGNENVIKIGAILSLTGNAAVYGEDSQRGINLAVEELNKNGGINGKKVEMIIEDDKSEPQQSVTAAKKLINIDKVAIIIGAVPSSCTLADAPIAESSHVVLLSPASSNPNITNSGDYIFRNWISDSLEGTKMAEFIFNEEKYKNGAILYINNDYGVGLRDVFEKRFKELGGEIVIIESLEPNKIDFRTQLTKINNNKPDFIYMPGYYKEMAVVLNQAAEMNFKTPFFSTVTFEDLELINLAGKNAEGVIYSFPYYNPDSKEKIIVDFVKSFKEKYKRFPGIFAAHGYDAAKIIFSVLMSHCYEADSVKNALYKVQNYCGVSGLTSFDTNGDVIKPVSIKTVKNGEFTILKEQ